MKPRPGPGGVRAMIGDVEGCKLGGLGKLGAVVRCAEARSGIGIRGWLRLRDGVDARGGLGLDQGWDGVGRCCSCYCSCRWVFGLGFGVNWEDWGCFVDGEGCLGKVARQPPR